MSQDVSTFPPHFDDAEAEYRAIREEAGLAEPPIDALEMTGEDRARFLSGQVTCDVASLAPGETTYGFFTTAKGRIESDVTVICLEDRFWLDLPAGLGAQIEERLNKYKIVDRVEIRPIELTRFSLLGPSADRVADAGAQGVRQRSHGSGTDLWAEPSTAEAVRRQLLAAGAVHAGRLAYERRRVELGIPTWGRDFGLDHFPQETGLEDAVSYTKGCYLGQEVVARIHYRGGVQRRLRGLKVHADNPESIEATEIRFNAKVVGRVGSVTSDEKSLLALSILHDKATVGSTVALFNGDEEVGSAEVVELPFGG